MEYRRARGQGEGLAATALRCVWVCHFWAGAAAAALAWYSHNDSREKNG